MPTPVAAGERPAPTWDVRLVPAAVTGWLVTAAGITWPVGGALAWSGLVLVLPSALLCRAAQRAGRAGWRVVGAHAVAVAVLAAGFGAAVAVRADAARCHPIVAAFGDVAPVTVTATESALPVGARRLMFRATLQRLGDTDMAGRVVVFAANTGFGEVMVGQPVTFPARITRPARRDLTVAMLTATGPPMRGRAGPVFRAAHTIRTRFATAAGQVLPAEQARILPALVLGDTSAVTAVTGREFRAAGLTHLMAVSGANVTIVCGAVLFSARLLVGPRVAALLAALALVAFVVVVQPTASVLRAAVMGAIALLGVMAARHRQALPSLAASVLVLLTVAPQLAVDVGFALSVLATAALVVIAPIWSARLVSRGWPQPLAAAVCVAWAAQLVTAPLIAAISGRFSLVSTAANLAAAPLVAPITVLGSAAAAICPGWPAGAQLLIRFTGPELWWVCRVARWSAGVPGATVAVPAGAAGVVGLSAAAVAVVLSWRWRCCRWAVAAAVTAAAICLAGWLLADLLTGRAGAGGP